MVVQTDYHSQLVTEQVEVQSNKIAPVPTVQETDSFLYYISYIILQFEATVGSFCVDKDISNKGLATYHDLQPNTSPSCCKYNAPFGLGEAWDFPHSLRVTHTGGQTDQCYQMPACIATYILY
jgi:hypothetical protein